MNEDEGFDVLRLIEHNQKCYISSDYTEGNTLVRQLKYHPNMTKQQVLFWIHEIARNLSCIHRCRGNPCYQYVTPYTIIVTREGELCFLDMGAKSNEKLQNKMNHRSVRDHFLPSEELYYHQASVGLDIYGYGKTIQYLLSETEITPALKKREEAKLRRIITKCLDMHSKHAYSNMSQIQKELPNYSKDKNGIKKEKRRYEEKSRRKVIVRRVVVLFLTLAIGAVLRLQIRYRFEQASREKSEKADAESALSQSQKSDDKEKNDSAEITDPLISRLGLLYFLDLKSYEESATYFSMLSNQDLAAGMSALAGDLSGKERLTENEIRTILEMIMDVLEERDDRKLADTEVTDYYRCLLRGYAMLSSENDARQMKLIGDKLLETKLTDAAQSECMQYMAIANEKLGDYDKSIYIYEQLLEDQGKKGITDSNDSAEQFDREKMYEAVSRLWEEKGDTAHALEMCRKGIEEIWDSELLKLAYIRIQCADSGIARELCAQTIKEYIALQPDLKESQEFKKLSQEYGIVVEGEEVWVGR